MPEFEISAGEKYGLIAIRNAFIANDMPDQLDLASGLWCLRKLPIGLPGHWKKWIGTLAAEALEAADLILVAKAPSARPDLLDQENRDQQAAVYRLYWGLLLTGYLRSNGPIIRVTGANNEADVDVRSFNEVRQPLFVHGTPLERITSERMIRAAELATAIESLPGKGKLARFGRVLHAFYHGILASDEGRRLHQFVRCVEGFIHPDQGQTAKQFKSRTELFIGPKHHTLVGEWYDLRSSVEHLHDPCALISTHAVRDQRLLMLRHAFATEGFARYCIARLLSRRQLWSHFDSDDTLKSFWKLEPSVRQKLWGSRLDIDALAATFDDRYIDDDDLGLA